MTKYILYSIAFLTGFAVMGYEILGVKVVAPIYGDSVHVWGAIISVFLAGLSIGYAAGGKLADRKADALVLSRIILFPSFLIVLFPFYGKSICNFFRILELDTRLGALLISTVFFLIPCIFLGAVIPMIVKILTPDIGKVGSSSGNVYSVSTAGSIAGTLFTSFFLISLMGVSKGILLVGMIVASCWFLCLGYNHIIKKHDSK